MKCPLCGGDGEHQRQCRLNSKKNVKIRAAAGVLKKRLLSRILAKKAKAQNG